MSDIRDVRDAILEGQVRAQEAVEEWAKEFLQPEVQMAVRKYIEGVPPEMLDQFARENPEAWLELLDEMEV